MRFTVVPYDPAWPSTFQTLKANLETILAGATYISIEHVGSTSVPKLCAKPVLDVDIIVPSDADITPVVDRLTAHGYSYRGEGNIPGRHIVRAPDQDPDRNMYVCVDGCLGLRNHLAVRDVLRADDQSREEYARLKMELTSREWNHVGEYAQAKGAVLQKILEKAGLSAEDLESIKNVNEAGLTPPNAPGWSRKYS